MTIIKSKYLLFKPRWRSGRTCQYKAYRPITRKNQMPMKLIEKIKWQRQILHPSEKLSLGLKRNTQQVYLISQWRLESAQIEWLLKLSSEHIDELFYIDALISRTFNNIENQKSFMQCKNHNSPFNGLSPLEYLIIYELPLDKKVILLAQHLTQLLWGI